MNKNRKINIKVINATLTKDVCILTAMSPYFTAKLSNEKIYKSKKKLNEGKFPLFNEIFSFPYNNEDILTINLFHSNKNVILNSI